VIKGCNGIGGVRSALAGWAVAGGAVAGGAVAGGAVAGGPVAGGAVAGGRRSGRGSAWMGPGCRDEGWPLARGVAGLISLPVEGVSS
jgi:hypothetical protein